MQHDWLKLYPDGVKSTIDIDQYSSVMELIEDSFRKWPNRMAYSCMGVSLTFAEIDELSKQFAAYLQEECGLVKGDRLAIQMPNCLQYPIVLFAALRCGATVVNTNPLYTASELRHQLQDANPKVLIILANFAATLGEVLDDVAIEHVLVSKIGDMMGIKGKVIDWVLKNIKKQIKPYKNVPQNPFKKALRLGKSYTYKRPELNHEDIAFLQYTGGTTGLSKGAMLSHKNIIANTLQIAEWKKPCLEEGKETIITALPLYHVFALTVNCLSILKIGGSNVLIVNPRDMKAFIKEMKKQPFSVITGVNTLFNGLCEQPEFKAMDFSALKVSVGGGMAVQQAVADRWQSITGCPIVEGFGLTETSPVLTCNPTNGTQLIGSVGIPVPSTEVSLRDEKGEVVEEGQPGEIWGKGTQIMKGYWNNPTATADMIQNGWLQTGDIGIKMPNGYYRIVDRKKEMICVSGFNVYPNEVEDALAKNEKIKEVGVIGVPDAKTTEGVKAYVIKRDKSLTEEEVILHSKTFLTGYKRPRSVHFVEELPKSNVGKILRRKIKEMDQASFPEKWT